MSALAKALVAARRAFKPITRSRTVTVRSERTGGQYSYSYAPMDTVLDATVDALTANGIVVMQPVCNGTDGDKLIRTVILHESGERLEYEISVPWSQNPQDAGKAITYLRRYAYVSALGLATEEDDDASDAPVVQRTPPKPAVDVISSPPPKDGSKGDMRRMFSLFDQLGLGEANADALKLTGKGRDELLRGMRLTWIAERIGRKIGSSSDLTPEEVQTVVRHLETALRERGK